MLKIGLGPKILSRARLAFSLILSLVVIFSVAGIYQGIQSGDFYNVFVKPFKQTEPVPTLAPLPTPTAAPLKKTAPTPKPAVKQQTQPAVANCIRKNIREGEFASNKCYSGQDYEDLQYYLGRYNSSVFEKDSQEAFIKVTCPGMSEMFQKSCEEHKQKKSQAETDINKYRSMVQGIIAKGQ